MSRKDMEKLSRPHGGPQIKIEKIATTLAYMSYYTRNVAIQNVKGFEWLVRTNGAMLQRIQNYRPLVAREIDNSLIVGPVLPGFGRHSRMQIFIGIVHERSDKYRFVGIKYNNIIG